MRSSRMAGIKVVSRDAVAAQRQLRRKKIHTRPAVTSTILLNAKKIWRAREDAT